MRWISYVRSRISKLPRRASRQQHDLNVVDQWVVRLLCRFGACTYRRVEAELQAIRGTPPAEVVTCLLKLEAAGLIERGPVSGLVAEERVFRLTRQGRRLARLVPAAPRSPTIFYP
jgi:DNA-binding MarR family transcriptional regulator